MADGCTPKAGAAVYAWHCDAQGRYSLYSNGVTNQNYLRGVQEADADGWVTFQTIFPGCYDGRWPHVHFEVYESLADASSVKNKIATSQLALPQDVCEKVYADTTLYPSSANALKRVLAHHRQRLPRQLADPARHRHRRCLVGLRRPAQRRRLTRRSGPTCHRAHRW